MKKAHRQRVRRSILEYAVVTAVGFLAFRAVYASRGGGAPGGELLFLMLPLLWYAAKQTTKDWLEDVKQNRDGRFGVGMTTWRDET